MVALELLQEDLRHPAAAAAPKDDAKTPSVPDYPEEDINPERHPILDNRIFASFVGLR